VAHGGAAQVLPLREAIGEGRGAVARVSLAGASLSPTVGETLLESALGGKQTLGDELSTMLSTLP
jgi:hypothetical protein